MTDDSIDLKVRGIPSEVHELMKERAKRNFRSLNMQIIADMQEAAHQEYAKQQEEGSE